MMTSANERDLLSKRTIPRMNLSTTDNPLTAPLSPLPLSTPEQNALTRFRVEGAAVVTGGAGALGLASARALLEHGLSTICLFDLPSTLASTELQIERLIYDFPSRKIFKMPVDVSSPTAVDEAIQEAATATGGLDIVCCFAGIVSCMPSIETPTSQFEKVLDVNLLGSFNCAQSAARIMIKNGRGGSIILIASISAHHVNYPQPQAAYNVSKAGVVHLTRNLAAEWASHGIRVNSISPGYMDTVLNSGDNLKEIREIWASRCPMGRMGVSEEITGAVVLLASKRASRYITGADLLVDGGTMCL